MADLTVISLGAGVQSTALLLMCLEGDYPRPDCAIFSDTGWEPKHVYVHLARLQETCKTHDFPLHVVSKGNLKDDVLREIKKEGKGGSKPHPPFYTTGKDGKGAPLWRKCTEDYKILPIRRFIRGLLPKGGTAEQWFGISLDEAQRMRDSRVRYITHRYPLIDMRMDRHNCQQWLERAGWGDTPRSACLGCPYHSNQLWREMRSATPDEWSDTVTFDKALREQPYPGTNNHVYLHRDLLPLDEIDLSSERDRGQMDLFGEECEGMCGV